MARVIEVGIQSSVLKVGGGRVVRPEEYSYRHPPRLPVLSCCSHPYGESGLYFEHRRLHRHRNSRNSRKYELLWCPSGTSAGYPTFSHKPSRTQTSETSNVPVGNPAKVGVGSGKLHTSAMRGDVSRNSPDACLTTSVMIALSREVAYIPCGAAMVACPQVFYWSSKRVAVRILLFLSLFVTGLFLLPQGKAVHWFFRQIIADFKNQRSNVSLFYSESLTFSLTTRRQKL